MEIKRSILERSVKGQPFGVFEPFVTGDDASVAAFYSDVFAALEKLPAVSIIRDDDHYGSGYASYVSAFLFPSDGRSCRDVEYERIERTGILLYLSRLAPIAVYGAGKRWENKLDAGGGFGFISTENLGKLPGADWTSFLEVVQRCLEAKRIELLPSEPLLLPAPEGMSIPTIFDGPYHVFDTLFYWSD